MIQHVPSHALRARVVLAILSALALIGVFLAPVPASAAPPSISVSAATDPAIAQELAGVPTQALPYVLAAVGTQFEVTVSVTKVSKKDLPVGLNATGTGQLSNPQATIVAGTTSVTVAETYSEVSPAVTVTATSTVGGAATPKTFPVDAHLNVFSGKDATLLNGTAGADGAGCTTVDATHPMCGLISLPRGATGSVALSLGQCPAEQCGADSLVTQFIANLTDANGDLYSHTSPARMTIICDKSLCGQGGVPHYTALWSQSATGALQAAPVCPSKGVIGTDQDFCTDQVSSTRDGVGDLLLVVLFTKDVRGTI